MSVTAVPLQPVKTSFKIWLWLGIIVAVAAAFGLAWIGTRAQVAAHGTNEQFLAWNGHEAGVHTTASGLQYQVIKAGTGPNSREGDFATVTIEGRLRDGTIFQPHASGPIPVAAGRAIPGFIEALKLMNKGAHYRIWLSPKLGYDATPDGGPPELKGQVLIFDVELTELTTAQEMQMRMMQQQMMQQQQQQQQGGGPGGGGPGGEGPAGPPEGAPKQ